ncbi:acyl-CoA dehydrogenase family protein [Variovorax sp. dw_954]|uniref:acyl-CoA dehydrogenase family protein n=1 Tax=Variovorax sp. dw_954 TaxID=2720078 RepID=UPI001BD2108D|nr:acyl-CoA dehydrogenase family protein [Variovorax sp. dw_954]
MQFTTPSEEQRLTVEVFRAFAQREVHPVACKHRHRVMSWATAHEVQQMVAEFGLPGAAIPKALGGLGLSCGTQGLLFEQFAQAGGEALPGVQDSIVVARLLLAAAPAIRDRYLPDVIAGRKIGALGAMEAAAGAASQPLAQARLEDGHWLVTADEIRVSNGINSDFVICPVRTAAGQLALVLVERDAHRYEVRLDHAAGPADAGSAEVFTASASVPADHLLAQGDEAQQLLAAARTQQWILAGLGSVGLMQLALEESIAHARAREEFGRPMAAHRLVAARIAEMATRVESARLMCHRCLAMVDAGIDCETEAGMARWYASEAAAGLHRQARQLRGVDAPEWDGPHEHRESFKRAGADRAVEIQKLVAAQALTGISALS